MKNLIFVAIVSAALMIAGCESLPGFGSGQVMDGDGMINSIDDTQISNDETNEDMTTACIMVVRVGDMPFSIDMEDNPAANEFVDKVDHGGLTVDMHDYGNFEKVGDLPWNLPTDDKEITTKPGDLILYQGDKITIYYDENTWNFTKLGHLSATPEEIKETFGGKEDITAEFFVEWTE